LKQDKKPNRLRYWHNRQITLNEATWIIRSLTRRDDDSIVEFATFEIDFSLSNKRLGKLFDSWLRTWRKRKGYKERQNRGPSSQTDRLRHDLMALGARRLERTGMTYNEAADYTKKETGRALYVHASAWSNALKRMENLGY
jgi:hypothetical protein